MPRTIFGLAVVIALFASTVSCWAEKGKYNPQLAPGDLAPTWNELPGTDDKLHSLADLADKDFVVIVFTCNSCPTATDYEDRLLDLTQYLHGINGELVAISSNDTRRAEEDGLEGMKEKSAAKKFSFPYLRDEDQSVARAYGATFTPEFFLLDKERRIVYEGALDDNTMPDKAKINYIKSAIQAVQAGKEPEVKETVARGCTVRYVRQRR